MSNFWIWIDTALIVAIITLIGAIIQVFGPAYLERRKARRKESEGSQA
jgi:NADH:ubiquinone oxidoreductase subunit 5 (subunit L)/multisubunit Na+/H+ antiporter MnhA subunit